MTVVASMAQSNPYAAPSSELIVEDDVEFGDPAVFSLKCRIGRLRYLARVSLSTVASYVLVALVVGGSMLTAALEPTAGLVGAAVGYSVAFFGSILLGLMFAVQRLHDLNHTGWIALLMLIPLVNLVLGLYLLFARGTARANDYGPPPPPNTLGITLAALIFPLIAILGMLAAIAIPAYQDYALRAQQAQQIQLDAE